MAGFIIWQTVHNSLACHHQYQANQPVNFTHDCLDDKSAMVAVMIKNKCAVKADFNLIA
ncbi:hypothetical protein SAMN02745664_12523 [Moraxella cuniculi DSM 21768]|uniref:Uncharacterized protein n=2 Tax=Moraxella cuniculi TaxID=34061 RepID=A0A1N7G8J3_9GAMM|nr:hypothetical protein [Moraxella cuniculi]SIS08903.1 hypothetical protein SAMN02745664_12523 [Moraxella cuniculi DSM 21768]VEG13446.1 Uncharacterised protein [Moraxella cuniculi]